MRKHRDGIVTKHRDDVLLVTMRVTLARTENRTEDRRRPTYRQDEIMQLRNAGARTSELADPVVSAAEAERDHAARLLAEHQRTCRRKPCDDCRSLSRHCDRTRRQVALLASDAETEAMF